MKLTLKQFLLEGGKATAHLGTSRASQEDIKSVLKFLAPTLEMTYDDLANRILGSGRLTLMGKQKDSGDLDLALAIESQDEIVKKITELVKSEPRKIGLSTFSFAVPATGSKKIQVDLMFVPSIDWAQFSHYASENSKHKSGVRNELLHSALKYSAVPGKDLIIRDKDGNLIVRVSRSYDLINGVKRVFKIAKKRKDGKGRVKGLEHVSPEEVEKTLKELGRNDEFAKDVDVILDAKRFAEMLFGRNTTEADLQSVETLIKLISARKDKNEIFKDAVSGIKARGFDIPDELKQFES